MVTRKFRSLWLLLAPIISHRISTCNAFTFVFSSQPSQCQSLNVQWSEGKGPYRLFLVPVGHLTPETRTIVNMEIPAGQSSTSLTLKFPEKSQFVAVMSDSTGFGTGGTSSIYTVGSGPSDCVPTNAAKADFYMYTDEVAPSQCGSYGISWDAGVTNPVHIYGIIPGGQSFDLAAPSTSTRFDWTTNVREGTQMLFLAVGGNNENGGSTDVTTVSSGSSGCINEKSPSSTASPAAGAVSTAAQSGTLMAPNPTGSGGPTGAPASATGTPGATATAGGTNTPGATAAGVTGSGSAGPTAIVTDSTGGSAAPTGSPATTRSSGPNHPSPGQPTNGSGGGTVTGPGLPVATTNFGEKSRRLNLGAIIGGTLGGVALILLLILIWLMYAHRRNERGHDDRERLMTHRRTDLLADAAPIMSRNQSYEHDGFRAEPFVPPMSADEFAQHTGGNIVDREEQGNEYHDNGYGQSMSSLHHGAVTDSSAAAAMYGALARTPSYSTSGHGHGHRSSHSHSRSQSHSHNVSHSPAHSIFLRGSSHGHSRSFSNPFSLTSFIPNSGPGRRDSTPLTPPTPVSATDPFASPVVRPPPSSWYGHPSTSAEVVPRARRSTEQPAEGKSGEADMHELNPEAEVVDIPPTYASLKTPRVTNPDLADD